MLMTFDVDPQNLESLLASLRERGVQVDAVVPDGPGGGCPEVTVTADTFDKAAAVVGLYFLGKIT